MKLHLLEVQLREYINFFLSIKEEERINDNDIDQNLMNDVLNSEFKKEKFWKKDILLEILFKNSIFDFFISRKEFVEYKFFME